MKSTGIVAAIAIAAACGCVNSSTLQTARALDPGTGRVLIGGGYYASPSVDAEASDATGQTTDLALPYLELGYRRGVAEHLELGAKLTVPGTVGIDGKYQLLDSGGFAVGLGLGLSYLSISSGEGADEVSTSLIDTAVPVYLSYDFSRAFSLYAAPRYVLRFASSTDSGMSTSATTSLIGATTGVKIGDGFGLFLEASYLKDVSRTFDSFQVNGSIFF